ncbi:MAG: hypothetical protein KatS3mg014_1242 [Actinomycetota bacterium]|nr:MAG: hypothetical protein KatS3mg014_1242 [Actinomycetota bacterium]
MTSRGSVLPQGGREPGSGPSPPRCRGGGSRVSRLAGRYRDHLSLIEGQQSCSLPRVALHPVLREKLAAGLEPVVVEGLTRRDAVLPAIRNKVHTVLGMRRVGKTTFLRQLQHEKQSALGGGAGPVRELRRRSPRGPAPRSARRPARGSTTARSPPSVGARSCGGSWMRSSWSPDGSASSADSWTRRRWRWWSPAPRRRLLSREVHTSLRGRGFETILQPFSFREFLRHRGEEPTERVRLLRAAERSLLERTSAGVPGGRGASPKRRGWTGGSASSCSRATSTRCSSGTSWSGIG